MNSYTSFFTSQYPMFVARDRRQTGRKAIALEVQR